MHEQTRQFGAMHFEQLFEQRVTVLEHELYEPYFAERLFQMMQNLEEILRTVAHKDGKTVFIVGGKSRRIVKVVLNSLAKTLGDGDSLKALIQNRLELTDEENRHLYGSPTSKELLEMEYAQGKKKSEKEMAPIIPEEMKRLHQQGYNFVFIDDHVSGGAKARKMVTAMLEAGLQTTFVALSAPPETLSPTVEKKKHQLSIVFHRERRNADVHIAGEEAHLSQFFTTLSRLMSHVVDIRLNELFMTGNYVYDLSRDEMSEEHVKSTQRLAAVFKKLQEVVAQYKQLQTV